MNRKMIMILKKKRSSVKLCDHHHQNPHPLFQNDHYYLGKLLCESIEPLFPITVPSSHALCGAQPTQINTATTKTNTESKNTANNKDTYRIKHIIRDGGSTAL